MKTIKSFFLRLYYYWFILFLLLITVEVFVLHNWSAWTYCEPFIVLLLATMTILSSSPYLSFLRYILWPLVEIHYMTNFKKMSPLAGFPLIVWLTFNGKELFIKGGLSAINDGFQKRRKELINEFDSLIEKIKEVNNNNDNNTAA
jgi:hypothetical protein